MEMLAENERGRSKHRKPHPYAQMDRREKKREKLRCADNKRQKLSPWPQTYTNRAIQRERGGGGAGKRRGREQITEMRPKPAQKDERGAIKRGSGHMLVMRARRNTWAKARGRTHRRSSASSGRRRAPGAARCGRWAATWAWTTPPP
jgi:hypothetical protein